MLRTKIQLKVKTIFLLCLVGYFTAWSQPIFEHITSDDGLSENVVNCIFQDSRGFMWFGTNDGLSKYDGNQFTVYKPNFSEKGSISSNLIFAITEDLEGNLWIGTTGSGLCKFDAKTEVFTAYKSDPNDPRSLTSDYINKLFTDSKGRIWIGSARGLNVFDPSAEETVFYDYSIAFKNNFISAVREDKKGNIWVASRKGLYRSFDVKSLDKFQFGPQPMDVNDNADPILLFEIDEYDRKVVLRGRDLFYQNKDNENAYSLIGQAVEGRAIIIDLDNKIWLGSDLGLFCYEKENNAPLPQLAKHYVHDNMDSRSLSKNLVNSLYQDRGGIIWVGVNGGGLNKFNPNRKAFSHISNLSENEKSSQKIRAILEDSKGTLWVGTEGDGLFWREKSADNDFQNSFNNIRVPNRPFALEEVTLNDKKWLFVGAEVAPVLSRVAIDDAPNKQLEPIAKGINSVFSILQDKDNNIWVGTYNGGLWRWTPSADGERFEKIRFENDPKDSLSISNNIIRKIVQDSRGNIWLGTGDGLNKISANQTGLDQIKFEVYKNVLGDNKSLSHNYILDIFESTTGEIWVGTFGGGLNRMIYSSSDTAPYFENFTEEDGLSNNTIKSILEDPDGNLWLSSNRGLTKFNPKDKSIFNFNLKDGLQANEFSEEAAFYRNNGEMIFGGANGFNIFNPTKIEINDYEPVVHFTQLNVLNEAIQPLEKYNGRIILDEALSYKKQIKLNYNENNFSVAFAALDFLASDQITYKYMLDGYDEDWKISSARNPLATYTNLPHGKYTLMVKSTNSDGIWNDKTTELGIVIKPPIWLTWYAYLFYALSGFGILWFFRRYELIGIQEKNDLKVAQLEREKREEIHDLKLRFFTNISHEFRTPLTLIIAPLENLIKAGSQLSAGKINEQYHLMYKNSKYLLRLVDQLLDFRKLDQGKLNLEARQGNIVEFIKEATQPFEFIASKQNVRFSVESDDDAIYLWFDPDVVEKILYNLLSNAFKNTPADGEVVVKLSLVEDGQGSFTNKNKLKNYFQMEVIDSGKGISSTIKKKIFERFYKEGEDKFSQDGAGIGLSFTKSLVKRHYGEISVKSKRGEGANFIVRLPLSKNVFAKGETFNNKITSHHFSTDPLEYFSPEKPTTLPEIEADITTDEPSAELPLLLFVDDNSDIRKFIKSGFENDFRIILAENGVKGLEMAKSSIPDIIISDIMMPEMDGIEMCKALKTSVGTSHIPIVLLTAKTTSESEIEGLETGADAYVKKPFKLNILKQQILNIHSQREVLKSRFRKEVILQPKEITVTTVDEEFLQRAVDLVEEHMSDAEYNVEALVKDMYISRSKLYLKIKALTGYSTSEFIRTIRLKRAVQLLEQSDYTIKEIMFMTGFNTASYFSKCFKKLYGIVPSEYVRSKKNNVNVINE
ncbi:MAG: two-component regulator propeller domain-containing protein [Bacteroidota bacterium]